MIAPPPCLGPHPHYTARRSARSRPRSRSRTVPRDRRRQRIGQRCRRCRDDDVALRVVEAALRQARAAAALDHAKGDWLVFRRRRRVRAHDELLSAIARSDGARGVQRERRDGTRRLLADDHRGRVQSPAPFIGNYMQSVRRSSAARPTEGARRRHIACFEDWDFIIQLALLTRFVHLAPAITGVRTRAKVARGWRQQARMRRDPSTTWSSRRPTRTGVEGRSARSAPGIASPGRSGTRGQGTRRSRNIYIAAS